MHLMQLVFFAVLLGAVFACKPTTCTKLTRRKIFFLVDGTIGMKDRWDWITQFIKLFKNHIDRSLPVKMSTCLMYLCSTAHPSNGCGGVYEPLYANWTVSEFDEYVDRAYKLNPEDITLHGENLQFAPNMWEMDKEYEDKCDEALLVFISDGERPVFGLDINGIAKKNKELNLNFFGVHLNTTAPFTFDFYEPLVSDENHIAHVSTQSELNEELAKRIINV